MHIFVFVAKLSLVFPTPVSSSAYYFSQMTNQIIFAQSSSLAALLLHSSKIICALYSFQITEKRKKKNKSINFFVRNVSFNDIPITPE